ncbi:ABC transporter substrate-binding protein (plasmid) [Coraliomargarita sp. W4R53]
MNISQKGRVVAGVIAVGAVLALAGCTQGDPTAPETDGDTSAASDTIVVGSFAFPESEILGEIYAQALVAAGFDVDTQFNIGPRQQTIPALQDGSINLMPEYNGNLLAYYDTEYEARSTEEVDAALVEAIAADDLVVYNSAEAQDKDAYVVTSEFAEANSLTSIGDLVDVQPFVLGANPQFAELGYGLPGLESVYGVGDVDFIPYEDFGGPDTVRALVDDTVQVADIYTTSPALVAENLVVLEDPENLIAAQNILPLVSSAVDSEELAAVLNEISAVLTTEDLIALRDRVEGDEQASAATAATDWLTEMGLL